ncbi:hypothetical protein J3R82DRAFT_6409 [Butyriboletus roseoflavus]|nr:hypothetical protein J3R82DRAFT_6409 [Butyriboletus roseoflavus]
MFGLVATVALATIAIFQGAWLLQRCALTVGSQSCCNHPDCNAISAQYSVSTYQLAAVNTGIIDVYCSNLYVGEVICLGLTGQDCETTYVVQSGDTCLVIAGMFNIPESTLLQNNPNVNPSCTNINIYPLEVKPLHVL